MSDNLVMNGDFETNDGSLNAWSTTSSGSGVTNESETITTTNNYCQIATTESVYQQVPLQASVAYNLTFNTKGTVKGQVAIMLVNSNTSYWSQDFNSGVTADWHAENFSFTPDSSWGAGPFVLHFHSYSGADGSTTDIDNVVLTMA
ncbi:hypothetical protein [Klebsiella aerogenes]|uniref:hypothetical protein n=1 Tax=Klebsiella aerogenes TaxID=548 RepID=UPI0034D38422